MSRYEFKSPTQKPIYKVSESALKARKEGISNVRARLDSSDVDQAEKRELISAMNFSVSEAVKELKRRSLKGNK